MPLEHRAFSPLAAHRGLYRLLLCGTALSAIVAGSAFAADEIVDGASHNVNGDGSGSKPHPWTIADDLYVGQSGTGVLTIENGGEVSSSRGLLGYDAGSNGTVTVTESGSEWTTSSQIYVGINGTGTLTVENGGTVTSAGRLGLAAGSSGVATVTVRGSFSTLVADDIEVGSRGRATLTVSGSGAVYDNNGTIIGEDPGGKGTVTVTGTGSNYVSGGAITIGDGGTGTFTVSAGANVLESDGVHVGASSGGVGTLTITGTGSGWTGGDMVYVGEHGEGTLIVSDGGELTNTGIAAIGVMSSGAGAATVTGTGSSWTSDSALYVGAQGTGTLTVSAGGEIHTKDDLSVGFDTGSTGTTTVTGSGSTLLSDGIVNVGYRGEGTLTVSDGATLTDVSGAYIGREAGSEGTAIVTGSGSSWSSGGEIRVGGAGTGTLTVSNGASVETGTSTSATIGTSAGSNGTLIVSGSGSSFETDAFLYAGLSGSGTSGTIRVEDGGSLTASYSALAGGVGTKGTAVVTGSGSSWISDTYLFVGINGTGDLSVLDAARATAADIQIGDQSVSSGRATVSGAGSLLSGGSEVVVGDEGTGVLTVSDGGSVSVNSGAGQLDLARATGSTGTLNIGAASGDTAMAAGTVAAASVVFGDGTGKVVFNHTSSDYEFDAVISGNGTVDVHSGETILTAAHTYTGDTTVYGGLLTVNGSIASAVTLSGGAIGGSGTFGAVTVLSGGAIAPGNSVGTLHAGNVTFGSGSSYNVELNDGGFGAGTNNDLIDATGTVTISGARVSVSPENGADNGSTYTEGTYRIITAAGGVTGTFDGISDSFVFLDFALSYDANNVYMTSEQVVFFTDIAKTSNQRAVAATQQALGSGTVYDALVSLVGDNDAARAAFDDLSGEIHASLQTTLIEDSGRIRKTANDRIRAAFAKVAGGSVSVATNGPAPNELPYAGEGFAVWGQAFGGFGSWDGDGNAASVNRRAGGLLVGADYAVSDDIRLGILGGYSRSLLDNDARHASATTDSYHVGLFGGARLGAVGLRGGGSLTWSDTGTSRSVTIGTLDEHLKADYGARTLQVFGEAGYSLEAGKSVLEPYAGVAYLRLTSDAFSEKGGSAALKVRSDDMTTAYSTIGVRAATDLTLAPSRSLSLTAGLAWRHAFGDVTPETRMAFAGSNSFTVSGVPLADDVLLLEMGAGVNLTEAADLGVSYSGTLGSGTGTHGLKARLAVEF
jgi:outer membrane autotransporter protein